MDRKAKPYFELAQEAGLTIERVVRGRHIKLCCVSEDGRRATFIAPVSPGDFRALKNKLAHMRRFARGASADHDPETRHAAALRCGKVAQ